MSKQAAKAAKLEKRLGVTLGGYLARSHALSTQLATAHEDLLSTELELASFKNLRIMEEAAVGARLEQLNKEVTHLSSRESFLQQKWDGLNRERQDVVERIEKLQQLQQKKSSASGTGEQSDGEDVGPQPMVT